MHILYKCNWYRVGPLSNYFENTYLNRCFCVKVFCETSTVKFMRVLTGVAVLGTAYLARVQPAASMGHFLFG